MGDMGEIYSGMRKAKQQKRQSNTEQSTQILIDNGIGFASKNGGAHLILEHGSDTVIDFWPSTGLYKIRGVNKEGRGIRNLLKIFGVKHGK